MKALLQDLRYAARMLAKRPGFTSVAALTLALGIEANTAIFSVVNPVLLQPLPYQDSDRLAYCSWQFRPGATGPVGLAETQYVFFRENSTSFEDIAAYADSGTGYNLSGSGEPVRVPGVRVSENFFGVLGINPLQGRSFSPEEARPGGPDVALVSEGMWRSHFGSDPALLGSQIQLNGRAFTVVGILPPDFKFEPRVDVIVPLRMNPDPRAQGHNTSAIARVRPGVSFEQAQAEMEQLLPVLREQFPNHIGPREAGVRLIPYREFIVGDTSAILLLLFGAVGLVLLIACANVANLLLARASSRSMEMAIRSALGARPGDVLRMVIREGMLLASIGIAIGLVAAFALTRLMSSLLFNVSRTDPITYAGVVVLLAAVALLTCYIPARRATKVDPMIALRYE